MPPKKTLDEPSNDTQTAVLDKSNDQTSILIFISAKALGSLGFAMSLLAIWFGWLLPASINAPGVIPPEELDFKKLRLPSKHPRRPTSNDPDHLPMPMRRASAPVNLAPILAHHPEESHNSSRRVYFSDIPLASITRRNTIPEQPQDEPANQTRYQGVLSSVYGSSVSSTSTLPIPASHPGSEYLDEVARESDSSLQSCKASLLKSASRLQKLKLGFHVRAHHPEPLDKSGDQSSITSTETAGSDKSVRRASGGFVPLWTIARNRTAPDVTADAVLSSPSRLSFTSRKAQPRPPTSSATTTATVHDVLSPTFLSRKQKRSSAPIPRTSPYGAPYFATPPLLISNNDNNFPAYLKGLPQFEDEVQFGYSQALESSEPSRGRNPSIRRVSLNPATAVHKRSASEDWNTHS